MQANFFYLRSGCLHFDGARKCQNNLRHINTAKSNIISLCQTYCMIWNFMSIAAIKRLQHQIHIHTNCLRILHDMGMFENINQIFARCLSAFFMRMYFLSLQFSITFHWLELLEKQRKRQQMEITYTTDCINSYVESLISAQRR